jgi:hypothetical protein
MKKLSIAIAVTLVIAFPPAPGAAIDRLKASGSTVVSAGGVPATLQGGIRAAVMPDTDGLYFVLIQAAPPRPEQPR